MRPIRAARKAGGLCSMGLLSLSLLLAGCLGDESAPRLQSVELTPANPQVAAGTQLQMTATGLYSDGSRQDLTGSVVWWSSDPTAATVAPFGANGGRVSALARGAVAICAAAQNIEASRSVTVTPALLVSLQVTPANPNTPKGVEQQFTASGIFSDNSTQNLTAQVLWSSSNTAVASISNASDSQGLSSSAAVGSTSVSASLGTVSGSTALTVTSATLVSIAVTPANPSTPKGVAQQFTATGTYSDNSTQNLTPQVTWSSSNPGVATISTVSGSQELASAVAVGRTTISATSGAVSAGTTLTVTSATLVSIGVTPANPSVAHGLTQPFTATGTYSDNSTQNLTAQLTWGSSNTGVATISNASGSQGLASSAGVGSTTISATSGSISGSTDLTVTSATLVSIAVTPTNPSIANGLTEPFTATGTYTDNSTQNLTAQLAWGSSNTGVATISNASGSQGLASSAGLGMTTISAASGSLSGSTTLTVQPCAVGFSTCQSVTIDHTRVGNSDSSNFPLLFSGTYALLATVANGGAVQNTVTQEGITVPADAVFAADSGCTLPLNWEVESYDPTSGAVNLWVQIPTLSHSIDTVIYLCVGNASVTSFQGGALGAAWDRYYQAVYHFPNGTTLSANDSTVNVNDGTVVGSVSAASGIIYGGASNTTPGPNGIRVPDAPSLRIASKITLSAWVNYAGMPSAGGSLIVQKRDPMSADTDYNYGLWLYNGGTSGNGAEFFQFYDDSYEGMTANTLVSATVWHYLTVTVDETAGMPLHFYLDGSPDGTPPYTGNMPANGTAPLQISNYDQAGGNYYLNGTLDELRISNTARSADWVTAEYHNQASPSTFYSVASY